MDLGREETDDGPAGQRSFGYSDQQNDLSDQGRNPGGNQ